MNKKQKKMKVGGYIFIFDVIKKQHRSHKEQEKEKK